MLVVNLVPIYWHIRVVPSFSKKSDPSEVVLIIHTEGVIHLSVVFPIYINWGLIGVGGELSEWNKRPYLGHKPANHPPTYPLQIHNHAQGYMGICEIHKEFSENNRYGF